MLGWIVLGLLLGVGLVIGTVLWWRVGDQWADGEHKKFASRSYEHRIPPRVISRDAETQADEATPEEDARP